ncbi:adenine-specific DNA-methyltransferase [Glaciecola punicea ACAM 611]|uniref:site-specific DNA-methyltransferase (adenine-specific) n=2 Tax=Glaciecola TaxID=89404 RepID=H5T9Q2_9ALTE|nr:adenine-specific DNA-methyltransferase [Glaciecola punicea ACAM 611]
MHSPDITQQNIDKLLALFPNCKIEKQDDDGELSTGIDFDLLKQELSKNIVEGPQERYQLNWPGKKEALLTANAPIAKALRPCREESVNFDTTENLFIEGDNLDALKLLQETYLGKVKMIYIDPPYNTGKDFIYADNFAESTDEYLQESGQKDDDGNRLVANTDSNGRFHSDWLSMMYSRLKLARNLLKDDGVIFISIDDNESSNIRKLGDEIFGDDNFIVQLTWEKKKKGAFLSGSVTNVKEYVFVFAKCRKVFPGLIGEIARGEETYPVIKTTNARAQRVIKKGIPSKYKEADHFLPSGSRISSGNMEMILRTDLHIKNGILVKDVTVESNWIYSQQLLDEYAEKKTIYITQELYFRRIVSEPRTKMLKDLLPMRGAEGTGFEFQYSDNLFADGWGTNEDGFDEIHELFGSQSIMSFPKPSKFIAKLLLSATRLDKDAIIMDFFAGSATTAHSSIKLNAGDSGRRKFIMVQLPETCDEKSEAFKAGYKTIAEISKERIRRAGKKIKEENSELSGLDTGFRVLKIDSSNMNDVHYTPDTVSKADLFNQVEHIKKDRSSEDLLFQVMLDWGVDLSLPIRKETIENKEVYFINDDDLAACFDKDIDESLIKALAAKQPLRMVFRDDGFVSDSVKINVEQIFKQLAPATDIKAI